MELIEMIENTLQSEQVIDYQNETYKQIFNFIHAINRAGRKWTPADITHIAETYYLNKDRVESIFKYVYEKFKDDHGIDQRNGIEKAEIYLKKKYVFSHNMITGQYMYRLKESHDEWKSIHVNSVYREMKLNYQSINKNDLTAILNSDFCPDNDPFKEYFERLHRENKWDGKTDWIKRLSNCIKCNDDAFFEVMFKKHLIRHIPCGLGLYENRYIMVFMQDKQETGKTRFVRYLNPFGRDYYTETSIFVNIKDGEVALTENFIYNLEEVEELTPKELSRMKTIISRSIVRLRKAYGVNSETYVRRCNFWASTNKFELLSDIQNARWICFKIDSIDWEHYSKNINIDDVWAQAYALYLEGYNYELTPEEKILRDNINKIYEARGNERDMLERYFVIPQKEGQADFMTNAEIENYLVIATDNKLRFNSYKIGRALGQLGFQNGIRKINGHSTRGWYVTKHQATESNNQPQQFINYAEPVKEIEVLPF